MLISFWLTVIGIIMNLAGTVLLIFSFPATFKSENGKLKATQSTTVSLFYERVFKEINPSIILALIFLVTGTVFQILGSWIGQIGQAQVAIMEAIIIKALESVGLCFSFLGTALMIRGGLDAFIKIVPREEERKEENIIQDAEIGNGKIKLDFRETKNPKRLLNENKIGMYLLAFGFFLQLIAMILE